MSKLRDIEDLLEAHIKKGEPREPYDDECCGNGCSPCVWDTYYDKLSVYQEKKADLEMQIFDIKEDDE